MTVLEKALKIIADWQIQTPRYFGAFHIIWLSTAFFSCVLIYLFRRRISARAVDIALIIWGALLIFTEVLKQALCSVTFSGGGAVWSYGWWAFPFQYCSVPLYFAIPAGALKRGAVKDVLIVYLATFAMLGGVFASFFPANMFSTSGFISNHTMFWHTTMVTAGFTLWAAGLVKPDFKVMLGAVCTFAALIIIALVLNITVYETLGDVDFNMFFISPYEPFDVPLIKDIYGAITYFGYLPLYVLTVVTASMGIYFVARRALR